MLNVIVWINEVHRDLNELIQERYSSQINFDSLETYDQIHKVLLSDHHYKVLFTVLNPSDIEKLYQIKTLQECSPSLSVIAVLDTNAREAAYQAMELMLGRSNQNNEQLAKLIDLNSHHNDESTGLQLSDLNKIEKNLTPRQHDVLDLIRCGKSNKEIARLLDLSEGTVKVHCVSIFKELNVNNRTQAAMVAEQMLRIA